jgi:hypothetical protein
MLVKRSQTATDLPMTPEGFAPNWNHRHCEERSDEAIQPHNRIERRIWIASSTAGVLASHSDRGMANSC